ncbi:MAG: hypothetical protein GY722_23535 [bacterium]|nr:hypothetical protein [bacterium]
MNLTRRSTLVGIGVAVSVALIAGWKWSRFGFRNSRIKESLPSPSAETASNAAPDSSPSTINLFPPEDEAIFFAIADVIVPRYEGSPAASEVALMPNLLSWVSLFPNRIKLYHQVWPRLRAAVVALDAAGLSMQCEQWFDEARMTSSPGPEAILFEAIRRHVLRAYYATPEGQSFAGYSIPEHLPGGTHQQVSMRSGFLS